MVQDLKCVLEGYYVLKDSSELRPSESLVDFVVLFSDVNTMVCNTCAEGETCVSNDKINWSCGRPG